MKNQFLKLIFAIAIALSVQTGAKAQEVRERPRHDIVEPRTVRPSERHFWREGEGEWRAGAYVWVPGMWVIPPHGNFWIRGHWRRTHRGWVWVPGHWR